MRLLRCCVLVSCVVGCLDEPPQPASSAARLIVGWDPVACGEPHRVALEIEDDDGARLSSSVPCNLGRLGVEISHFGVYRGRVYSWRLDAPVRSSIPLDLTIDQPIVEWLIATPQ